MPTIFTFREKVEWVVTALILYTMAFLAPRPRREIVNGESVAIVEINGWVVPKWIQYAILGVILGLVYAIVRTVSRRFWPVREEENEAAVDEKPPGRGTGLSAEHTPWVGTAETTAEEYLTAEGPNPMRAYLLGGDVWDREDKAFRKAQRRWLEVAPESVLRDMLPTCERLCKGAPKHWVEELILKLSHVGKTRGIPTAAEIEALVDRLKVLGPESG